MERPDELRELVDRRAALLRELRELVDRRAALLRELRELVDRRAVLLLELREVVGRRTELLRVVRALVGRRTELPWELREVTGRRADGDVADDGEVRAPVRTWWAVVGPLRVVPGACADEEVRSAAVVLLTRPLVAWPVVRRAAVFSLVR
jgi:hypothetical protein